MVIELYQKRIHVRFEHVRHSKSRMDFLKRVQKNNAAAKKAKETGVRVQLKRLPEGPRKGGMIKNANVETVYPQKFVGLYQG